MFRLDGLLVGRGELAGLNMLGMGMVEVISDGDCGD